MVSSVGSDAAVDFLGQTDATDGAGVNDAGAAGFGGGFDDIAGALHVGGIHRRVISQPKMIAGRDVKTPIAAAHGGRSMCRVRRHRRRRVRNQRLRGRGDRCWAQQCLDPMAARDQFVDEVGADKAGGAGDKTFHIEHLIAKERGRKAFEQKELNALRRRRE